MDILHVIILALIQGITEFLPISSSAHLILPKELLGWPDQGLAFDVAVHVGTLAAVVLYYRKDLQQLTVGWCKSLAGQGTSNESRLAWYLMAATIPACVFGFVFSDVIETWARSIAVIGVTTIVFGVFLGLADRKARSGEGMDLTKMTLYAALAIGFAQAIALIPGTSRSGITLTAALFLGFSRMEAARFSFLMSIPIILISGTYKGIGMLGLANVDWVAIGLGVAISAISAFFCIHYFLSFINRLGMMPFVIYRFVLGFFLLGLVYLN